MQSNQTPGTPLTEAGRALIAAWRHVSVPWMEQQVAAIEREATARVEADLRALRRELLLALPGTDGQGRLMVDVVDAAILAATEAPREPTDDEHEAWHEKHPGVWCQWHEQRHPTEDRDEQIEQDARRRFLDHRGTEHVADFDLAMYHLRLARVADRATPRSR